MAESDQLSGKVAVSADGFEIEGKAGGALSGIGRLGQWLFQDRSARATISAALADSIAAKIQSGESLNDNERLFTSMIFRREAVAIVNQAAIAQRAEEVILEVQARIGQESEGSTSATFSNRARSIAAEIDAEEIRDLFARVCAGEYCRPGGFSVRTLEAIRSLDPVVAGAFRRYRATLVDERFHLANEFLANAQLNAGITFDDETELREAGLIDNVFHLRISAENGTQILQYGDRRMRITRCDTRFDLPDDLGLEFASSHLTRVGRELSSVLPLETNVDYFLALGWSLTQRLGKLAAVEWALNDESEGHLFRRDPPAVVDVIPFGKENWILGRDPKQVFSNAITGGS